MESSVLVVDDDEAISTVLMELLTDEGYRVRSVSDGDAALHEIESAPPDVLISDVRMPYVDGVKLVTDLQERGLQIPVVLVSASPNKVEVPGAIFIPKPFDLDEILGAIDQCLATASA